MKSTAETSGFPWRVGFAVECVPVLVRKIVPQTGTSWERINKLASDSLICAPTSYPYDHRYVT